MSMGFSRQAWEGCHLLQGVFPNQGSKPRLWCLLNWQGGSLPLVLPGQPIILCTYTRCIAVCAPGADCGSDHGLLTAKFRLQLKKVGKTTSPFRYDLNQIPCDYSVEVTNRFKGLDLIDRVPKELWTEVCDIVKETVIKTIPQIKEMQEGKIVIWEGLTNRLKKKQKAKEKRKDILIWMQSSIE